MAPILLDVQDLQTFFFAEQGVARAVDRVSFRVREGRTVGIVGESGCGKSVTAHSILRLVPEPGKIVGGRVLFDGTDLLSMNRKELEDLRGNRISMIFQEPMTSLNPVFRVQDQILEGIRRHRKISGKEALDRIVDLLREVGIPSPETRMKDYPHQMSGGMRQRVMIAMAVACRPQLLIADEPTTALDVTIQAQILELLRHLRESRGTTLLLITHDLGVIASLADDVVVLYTGRVVEEAPVRELFHHPLHPYTRRLLKSIPGRVSSGAKTRLETIPGVVPSLLELPRGCKFNTRCPEVFHRCYGEEPPLIPARNGHPVRCWLYEENGGGTGHGP